MKNIIFCENWIWQKDHISNPSWNDQKWCKFLPLSKPVLTWCSSFICCPLMKLSTLFKILSYLLSHPFIYLSAIICCVLTRVHSVCSPVKNCKIVHVKNCKMVHVKKCRIIHIKSGRINAQCRMEQTKLCGNCHHLALKCWKFIQNKEISWNHSQLSLLLLLSSSLLLRNGVHMVITHALVFRLYLAHDTFKLRLHTENLKRWNKIVNLFYFLILT